jgi:hypothetical protein
MARGTVNKWQSGRGKPRPYSAWGNVGDDIGFTFGGL